MSMRFPLERVRTHLPRLIERRRALHAIPELGRELPRTAAYVETALRDIGLSPRRVGDGMWVDIGERGPLVALRADMDALPIGEETGAAYASAIHGRMHACGHDAHTAALLCAAEIFAQDARALPFRVRLIFQTGEEGAFGTLELIEAGVLEGVAAIAAGHAGDLSDELEPGELGFLPGPMMAASDRFRGAFVGSGGHGSAPHHSPDPIAAFAEYLMGLQYFRSRELDQSRPAVISVCQVEAGSTFNVIPERLSFMGTARSLDADIRTHLETKTRETGEAIATLRGLGFEFEWLGGYPPLVNDKRSTLVAEEAACSLFGEGRIKRLTRPIMGGEDFAYYLERIPGCFWFINTQAPGRGIVWPNHNPRFDLDESLLPDLCAAHLALAEALAKAFA